MKKNMTKFILAAVFIATMAMAAAAQFNNEVYVPVTHGNGFYVTEVYAGTTYDFFEQEDSTQAVLHITSGPASDNSVRLTIVACPQADKPVRQTGYRAVLLNCFPYDGLVDFTVPYTGTVCGYYLVPK